MDAPENRPTPSELRNQAFFFLKLAKTEADPQTKRGLAACAFALSQLAESIERTLNAKQR
jgi:hypothetical protein